MIRVEEVADPRQHRLQPAFPLVVRIGADAEEAGLMVVEQPMVRPHRLERLLRLRMERRAEQIQDDVASGGHVEGVVALPGRAALAEPRRRITHEQGCMAGHVRHPALVAEIILIAASRPRQDRRRSAGWTGCGSPGPGSTAWNRPAACRRLPRVSTPAVHPPGRRPEAGMGNSSGQPPVTLLA